MSFDIINVDRPSTRDKSLLKLPNSPDIMVCGVSTIFLSSDPNEFCNRLGLLLQERQAGNNSNIFKDEIVAILDKLLE